MPITQNKKHYKEKRKKIDNILCNNKQNLNLTNLQFLKIKNHHEQSDTEQNTLFILILGNYLEANIDENHNL